MAHLDGRTESARRAKHVLEGFISDLGGSSNVSGMELAILKDAAALSAVSEHLNVQLLAGDKLSIGGRPITFTEYLSGLNCKRRLIETVGLKRRPRDVSPAIDERRRTSTTPQGGT